MSQESDFLADLYAKYDAINMVSKPETYHNRLQREGVAIEDIDEGRVKDMLLDMEADATEMSKEEFIKAHGERYAYIWDRVNDPNYQDISDLMDSAHIMVCKDCGCEQHHAKPVPFQRARRGSERANRAATSRQARKGNVQSGSATAMVPHATRVSENGAYSCVP